MKPIFALAAIALLSLSTPALAEEGGGIDKQERPAKFQRGGGDGAERPNIDPAQREQKFQEMKAKILQKMAEREACVKAASNGEELRACMPKRAGHKGGEGREGKRFFNRGGGDRPDRGPHSDAPDISE